MPPNLRAFMGALPSYRNPPHRNPPHRNPPHRNPPPYDPPLHGGTPIYQDTQPYRDRRLTVILAVALAQMHNDLLGKRNHMRQMILQVIDDKTKDNEWYQPGMKSLRTFYEELTDDLNGREEFLNRWSDRGAADHVSRWGGIMKLYYSLEFLAHDNLNMSLAVLERGNKADIQILANAWNSSETTRPIFKEIITEFELSLHESWSDGRTCERIESRFNNLGETMRATRVKIEKINWVGKTVQKDHESQERSRRPRR